MVIVDKAWQYNNAPKADAMVTKVSGIALGILTADCAPVLFADKKAGIIAAAHAGWKGAKNGVLENTINAIVELGGLPANIVAAIGPCIGKDSYEVGLEFKEQFNDADFFTPLFAGMTGVNKGHFLFDLGGYVVSKLVAAGVGKIDFLAKDTLSDNENFFSYRRTTLQGGKDYGRQISVISFE